MTAVGFYDLSKEELLEVDGGGFWSSVAYYAFTGGMGALGAAAGAAIGGPVGGVIGGRIGTVVGGGIGAYVGDLIWDAAH
ncbi:MULTISPECIES: bacteriocin [Cohnella]|uniref:bacteriocin n=1 Tax=Cohnella TaxID=329857 RepID=UPI001119BDCB|nr:MULTISPECIES: bacteriocin [Cohnella]MBN2981904.1 bacteriocin [Cohnella algarum]